MNTLFNVNFATVNENIVGLDIANFAQIFSPYVMAFFVAYVVTEIIKISLISIKQKEIRWRDAFKSGGMPSSHSAEVAALAMTVGLFHGFGSALFGIAIGFAAIVIFDAFHVRRAVGEQGEVLRKLVDRDHKQEGAISDIARETGAGDEKTRRKLPKPFLVRGHKPTEVIVGTLIGLVVGVIIYVIY